MATVKITTATPTLKVAPKPATLQVNKPNPTVNIATNVGVGAGGSVISVTSSLPGLTFGVANTTFPNLAAQNVTSPSTQFLRGDGTWQVPTSSGGTVSSVALTAPTGFAVAGSPITSSGTLALTYHPTNKIPPAALGTGTPSNTTYLRGDGMWATPAGAGTVTSVALTMPSGFSVTGSPITNSGTLQVAWGTGLVPTANLATGTASSTTYLAGDQTWKQITLPTAWTGTGNALFKSVYALPAAPGTQTGVFQQLAYSDLNGSPFTLTTNGTSGPATFAGNILNIPQYSGGGPSPGPAGFSWTLPANIAVGDVVYATDLTAKNTAPGAIAVFDGTSNYLKEWLSVSGVLIAEKTVLLNNFTFIGSSYAQTGLSFTTAPFPPKVFVAGTYYGFASLGSIYTSTDLLNNTTVSVFTPPTTTGNIASGSSYYENVLVQVAAIWPGSGSNAITLNVYSSFGSVSPASGWALKFSNVFSQSTSFNNTFNLTRIRTTKVNNLVAIAGINYSAVGGNGQIILYSADSGNTFASQSTTNFGNLLTDNIVFKNEIYMFSYNSSTFYKLASNGTLVSGTLPAVPISNSFFTDFAIGTNYFAIMDAGFNVMFTNNGTSFSSVSPATAGLVTVNGLYVNNDVFYILGATVNNARAFVTTTNFVTFSAPVLMDGFSGSVSQIVSIGDLNIGIFSASSTYLLNYGLNKLLVADEEDTNLYPCANGSYRYLGGAATTREDGLWIRTA